MIRIRDAAPRIDVLAQFIDDRGGVVLLRLCRKPFALVKHEPVLLWGCLAFFRLGDRCNELGAAPLVDYLLGRLS